MKKLFLACFILMGFLTKAQTDLPEISSIEKIIDKYSNSDIIWNFGIGQTAVTKATYFSYSKKMKLYSKIKTVVVNTSTKAEGAKMKLHFCAVNQDGSPGNDLSKPLLFECKKGQNDTAIDVSFQEISIPENGIFVGFEWLLIEENKYTTTYAVLEKNVITEGEREGKETKTMEQFMPNLAVIPSRKKTNWEFKTNQWLPIQKDKKRYILGNNYNPAFGKYQNLAVSLLVTQ
jgi:hypothetical protein